MVNRPTLYEVFNETGIFSYLTGMPWSSDVNITNEILDLQYIYNRSGQKFVTPLVNAHYINGNISSLDLTKIANVIKGLYLKSWQSLWNTLLFEYNPISNYDMVETETSDKSSESSKTNTGTQTNIKTNSGTDTNVKTNTGTRTNVKTNTGTDNTSTSESGTITDETVRNDSIYGFNSSTASDSDSSEETKTRTLNTSGTNNKTLNLTENDTTTDDLSENDTRTLNLSENDTRTDNLLEQNTGSDTTDRTLTRSGNIGVTTTQQMIEQERELHKWVYFCDVVFPDLDRVLTLKIY